MTNGELAFRLGEHSMSKVRSIGAHGVEVRIADPGENEPAVVDVVKRYSRGDAAAAKELVGAAPVTLGPFPQRVAERLTNELERAGAVVALPGTESADAFLSLLDRCRDQVRRDPSGYLRNPHLYPLLQKVYSRLCHGAVPDRA